MQVKHRIGEDTAGRYYIPGNRHCWREIEYNNSCGYTAVTEYRNMHITVIFSYISFIVAFMDFLEEYGNGSPRSC